MTFETQLLDMFNLVARNIRVQPLVLGGYTGSGGGQGGPPGGFVGYLPQTRVAYDTDEFASIATPSGATLLDNLNHIRYRLGNVELSGTHGVDVYKDNVIVASGIHIVNFLDQFDVTLIGTDQVNISLPSSGVRSDTVYSGVFGENLTTQIGGTAHFTVALPIYSGSLAVYLNGVRQNSSNYTIDGDSEGFTLGYTPISGDTLVVDYTRCIDGFFHTHNQYALSSGILTGDQVLALLALKADEVHTHVMADITDLPDPLYVNQQYIFTIAGSGVLTSGTKPLRIYAHDVNTSAIISEVFVAFNTAPAITDVRMNVLKNGSTIFNAPNYVAVLAGQFTGSRTTDFVGGAFVKDDYFQIKVEQGDNTASDMTLHIRFSYEL